jgi:hypothetical protein
VKAFGKWRYSSTLLDLGGSEWLDSRLGPFTPSEIAPYTDWIGGLVSPRAGMDAVQKKKNLSSVWNLTSAIQLNRSVYRVEKRIINNFPKIYHSVFFLG